MSRRLTRIWLLLPMILVAGQAAALGLGDIRLSSALNEPLRAEIELLSVAPDELTNLKVQLASSETFERYGLERPLFLNNLQFDIVTSGTASGNSVRIRSATPITEPFVTFLVEAVWSRGRLLREYTVLLDPPTFAPPPVMESTQSVTAPSRSTQSDAGRIERPASSASTQRATESAPNRPPVQAPTQSPTQSSVPPSTSPSESYDDEESYEPDAGEASRPAADPKPTHSDNLDAGIGNELEVQRGDTLWGIASRVRRDTSLTMDQTMIAIFQANPQAFAGNINLLSAGSVLRIPSADDVYRISRSDAVNEVQRQHAEWGGRSYTPPVLDKPTLTLVPPDEDQYDYDSTIPSSPGYSRAEEIEDRIAQLEVDVPDQPGLLQIRNNELAQLRAELASLRGEEPPPIDDELPAVDDTPGDEFADDLDDGMPDEPPVEDQIFVDDDATDVPGATDIGNEPPVDTTPVVSATKKPSLVDTILGYVLSWWGAIAAAVIVVLGILIWFARRAGRDDDDDSTGAWGALDSDDDGISRASTERLRALARDDDTAIVVVEKESKAEMAAEMAASRNRSVPLDDDGDVTRLRSAKSGDANIAKSLEDTFSSETAINLDQSDPIAEADFHMAYGLHDQAADLINGALEVEPGRQDLLEKLCEVYFVWGNRDAFIDAAGRMKAAVGGRSSAEWDKIIIMGQQIAADHVLFSGQSAGEATKAVDLSFDIDDDGVSELDIDFAGGPDGAVSEIIDLGADSGEVRVGNTSTGIDFNFDEPGTDASITREMPGDPFGDVNSAEEYVFGSDDETIDSGWGDETAERRTVSTDSESTVETPTIEQQFADLDATGRMSTVSGLSDDDPTKLAGLDDDSPGSDRTAEIDLHDLGLDLDALSESGLGDDLDDQYGELSDLDATGENKSLISHDSDSTGRNPELKDTGSFTGMHVRMQNDDSLAETGEMPSMTDTTGVNPALAPNAKSDDDDNFGVDTSLLDATGQTQILSDDFAVETMGFDATQVLDDNESTLLAGDLDDDDDFGRLPEDAETLLAPLDDDGDFDFAKTEALPKDVFTNDPSSDETGELPSFTGSTDLDLDLDDLTAALKVSEVGDTVNQARDDATVEQPRIRPGDLDLDVGDAAGDDDWPTQALSPDDVSEDLQDARTMTEVGTKLDLARAYVDMGDPGGARSILEEVLDEGDHGQRQQAQQLLDSLPS